MRAILTLHSVDEKGTVLSMRPSELESLLDAMERSGHQVVPLSELIRHPGLPDRVAITFDDGLASVAEEALPLLARRGHVATVFVVPSRVGSDNAWPGQPAGIPTLPSMGWGELGGAHQAILERIGAPPAVLAYPYGQVDDRVRDSAARWHRFAVGGRLAALDGAVDHPLELPRLDSYYVRSPRIHRWFGSPPLDAWIALRRALREQRARGTRP
jgi:peptidoglycan/xylan/chitin deacetylase (PgdA/CDA1 family)